MGKSGTLRMLLTSMYNKNKRCYYCGVKTMLKPKQSQLCTRITATVEHLYCKSDIRRYLTGDYGAIVLACNQCNQKMNIKWAAELQRYNEGMPDVNIIQMLREYRMKQIAEWQQDFNH